MFSSDIRFNSKDDAISTFTDRALRTQNIRIWLLRKKQKFFEKTKNWSYYLLHKKYSRTYNKCQTKTVLKLQKEYWLSCWNYLQDWCISQRKLLIRKFQQILVSSRIISLFHNKNVEKSGYAVLWKSWENNKDGIFYKCGGYLTNLS